MLFRSIEHLDFNQLKKVTKAAVATIMYLSNVADR